MGRVKLQIKRIENTTNRQVTFSKRRNGLIKKAYELSVLCDVDVALIVFSPSGRLSLFSGNKSIEEILIRYVNLPEHQRGRINCVFSITCRNLRRSHHQELLQRAVVKLKPEHYPIYRQDATSTRNPESQIEDMQQEIDRYKSQIEAMERQLRIFEGGHSHITTLSEAGYQEYILNGALKGVQMRKQVLEGKCNPPDTPPPPPQAPNQVHHLSAGTADANGYITATEATNNILDWLPQRDPHVQILNCLDPNGLLPLRDHQPATLLAGQDANLDDHIISPGSGLEDDSNAQSHEFGQVADVNLGPWTEFYPTGKDSINRASEPRERALLGLYMNQVAPTILAPNQHPT